MLDDFGDQGAYYLADHCDRRIFSSVQALIRRELERLGLNSNDLIMTGSSKGGSAAILHGAAADAGRIIAGAPQVKIGSFLQAPHPNMLNFIMGDTSEESVAALDHLVFDAIEKMQAQTRLSILVGSGDHHYRNHVLPLSSHAEVHGKPLALTVLPGLPHAEIGAVFKTFLAANLHQELLSSGEEALPYSFRRSGTRPKELSLHVNLPQGCEAAFRLYKGTELVTKTPYRNEATAQWHALLPGRYRARVFVRSPKENAIRPFTTQWATIA
ncbi:hypothetical protein ACW0JT_13005 [Arthrobacter sp. SA17]